MFYIVALDEEQSILVLHKHSAKTFLSIDFWRAFENRNVRIILSFENDNILKNDIQEFQEQDWNKKILNFLQYIMDARRFFMNNFICIEASILFSSSPAVESYWKYHLIFIVSTFWFEGMSTTYQNSGLVSLCNNSDKILALRLQQCYKIITSNNHFALIWNTFYVRSNYSLPLHKRDIFAHTLFISSDIVCLPTFDFPLIVHNS